MTLQTAETIMRYYRRKNQRLTHRLSESQDAVLQVRLRRAIRQNLRQLELLRQYIQIKGPSLLSVDGGEGSGDWGHEGRPGKVGGSAPGGGVENRINKEGGGFTSKAKEKAKQKASAGTGGSKKGKQAIPAFVKAGSEKTFYRCMDEQIKKVTRGKKLEDLSNEERRTLATRTAFNWSGERPKPFSKEEIAAMDEETVKSTLQTHFERMAEISYQRSVKQFENEKQLLMGRASKQKETVENGISDGDFYTLASFTAERMTMDDYSAFHDYKSEGTGIYRSLNSKLRSGDTRLTEREEDAREVIERYASPFGAEAVVYRSVNSEYLASIVGEEVASGFTRNGMYMSGYDPKQVNSQVDAIGKTLTGSVQTELAPMSTGYATVKYFTNDSDNNVLIRMRLHQDSEVFSAPSVTEGEVILKPGAQYKITGVHLADREAVPTISTSNPSSHQEEIFGKIILDCEFLGYK